MMVLAVLSSGCAQRRPSASAAGPSVSTGSTESVSPAPPASPAPATPVALSGRSESAPQAWPALDATIPVARNDDPAPRQQSARDVRDGSHPERLSPDFTPKPFDPAAYQRDPQAYIDIVEPGRVWQVQTEAGGTPVLELLTSQSLAVKPLATQELAVRTAPRAPVSWYSPQGGAFAESQLSAVTVQADDQGIARVTWIAIAGTINHATVLVGSPMAAGTRTYALFVPTE